MKRIGYIRQMGEAYEKIEGEAIDKRLEKEMKKYFKVRKEDVSVLTKKKKIEKYEYIFLGFNIWKLYLEDKYDKTFRNLVRNKRISVPVKLIKLMSDKCELQKYYEKVKIPSLPTKCVALKRVTEKYIAKEAKEGDIFIKTNPGAHGVDTKAYKRGDDVREYIETLKKKEYHGVIIQPYVKDFASKANPEIRTIWVGEKFSHAVYTINNGDVIKTTKRIPKRIKEMGEGIIKKVERDFKFEVVYIRIDFGKYKGEYFVNEMEIFPGIFPEGNRKIIKLIAERIKEIVCK
jgi:glutathione synthase/RimK-type ligase-like ATP-grasp enzyme